MTERPILFSGEMVKAILNDTKTMTRRVVKKDISNVDICPYGSVGDRLWVRETWYYEEHMHDSTEGMPDLPDGLYSHRLVYKADCTDYPVNVGVGRQGWRPSIFMPHWASRITLEITDIKVERLQDITEEDAMKEGIPMEIDCPECDTARKKFKNLWDSINGRGRKPGKTWKDNPWVWVIEFKRINND